MTFRPEFNSPWIGQPHVTSLILNRLTRREVEGLIDRVAGNKPLAANVREDIIESPPPFVEEMTKTVPEAESQGAAERHGSGHPVTRRSGPCYLARLSDGAARSSRTSQGGGANRAATNCCEFSHALLAAGARRRRLNRDQHWTISLRLVCCSGRVRPHATICSSTR